MRSQTFLTHNSGKLLNAFGNKTSLFNSLPNEKILDWTKLKALADDKFNGAKMIIFLLDRLENIVGKGENVGYHHFLFFLQCFQKAVSPGSLKVGIVWEISAVRRSGEINSWNSKIGDFNVKYIDRKGIDNEGL